MHLGESPRSERNGSSSERSDYEKRLLPYDQAGISCHHRAQYESNGIKHCNQVHHRSCAETGCYQSVLDHGSLSRHIQIEHPSLRPDDCTDSCTNEHASDSGFEAVETPAVAFSSPRSPCDSGLTPKGDCHVLSRMPQTQLPLSPLHPHDDAAQSIPYQETRDASRASLARTKLMKAVSDFSRDNAADEQVIQAAIAFAGDELRSAGQLDRHHLIRLYLETGVPDLLGRESEANSDRSSFVRSSNCRLER